MSSGTDGGSGGPGDGIVGRVTPASSRTHGCDWRAGGCRGTAEFRGTMPERYAHLRKSGQAFLEVCGNCRRILQHSYSDEWRDVLIDSDVYVEPKPFTNEELEALRVDRYWRQRDAVVQPSDEADRMMDVLDALEDILKLAELVERLRGRLEGRRAMNERTLEGHLDQACGCEDAAEIKGRINGIELALMDLEYVAKEFGL